MTRSLAVAIGVVGLLFAAGIAEAKTRVAVVAFEGDDGGTVQEVVTDLLDGDYSVSGAKAVNRTVDKLGLDSDMSEKDLKKLANELEVDAILRGDLKPKGARKLLHVKVYVNGKKVRGFKVEFASVKSEKFKTALKDKIDEKLSGVDPGKKKKTEEVAEPAGDEEDPLGGKKTKKTAKADKAAEKSAKKAKADEEASEDTTDEAAALETKQDKPEGDEAEGESDEDEPKKTVASADIDEEDVGGVDTGVTVEQKGGRTPNFVAVRVDIGPSISARRLSFNSRNFEQAPKPYKDSPVGGMRVAGELYPLAFGNPKSFISGIGIAGHYDQTLKLNLESQAQLGTKFPVEQKHWSAGLRFRIGFGHGPKSPTVTLAGDYFHRKFVVDRSKLMEGNILDLPDVFYRGFDAGLHFRVPIIKQVALVLGGSAIFVRDTGQIQKLYSYGQAKVTAGQGMAGFDIVIANRVALRLTGEIAQFGYAFSGNGELTYNRDLDPTTEDVGGAADRYFGGAATLAVLY